MVARRRPAGIRAFGLDSVSATSRRRLLVFDSTTGIQARSSNPAVDLGTEAPTAQLREFQATWGGLSLANTSGADSVVVSCLLACSGGLSGPTSAGVTLSPTPTSPTFTRVGILIAPRRRQPAGLFGRRALRVRSVGRVPLGLARQPPPALPLERPRQRPAGWRAGPISSRSASSPRAVASWPRRARSASHSPRPAG